MAAKMGPTEAVGHSKFACSPYGNVANAFHQILGSSCDKVGLLSAEASRLLLKAALACCDDKGLTRPDGRTEALTRPNVENAWEDEPACVTEHPRGASRGRAKLTEAVWGCESWVGCGTVDAVEAMAHGSRRCHVGAVEALGVVEEDCVDVSCC